MQSNVQIPVSKFIEDLGTGFSYVNFDRKEQIITDDAGTRTAIVAGSQYRCENPITKNKVIGLVIDENYPNVNDLLRKGVLNNADPDFVAFNQFMIAINNELQREGF